jgi:hypothetical protein
MAGSQTELGDIFQRLSTSYQSMSNGSNVGSRAKFQLQKAAAELIAALYTPHEAAMVFELQNALDPCYHAAADCGTFNSFG